MDNRDLLKKYVNTGRVLPYNQYKKLQQVPQLLKSYQRARTIAVQADSNTELELYELPDEQFAEKIDITFTDKGSTEIPDFVYKTKKLDFLSLGGNNITNVPEIFAETISPTSIDFSGNNLTSLPENFGKLKRLRMLGLTDNQLTTLPESIGNLENIRDLYLRYNNLTSLPESIGKLQNLEYVDLTSNQLTALPKSIKYLKNLSMMYLRDNPMSQEYVDRLRTLLPNCEIIFEYK